MEDDLSLGEILSAIAANLQGIRSELRALRLEQRAGMGVRLTEADTADLQQALNDAAEIADVFLPCEEPDPVRVLS